MMQVSSSPIKSYTGFFISEIEIIAKIINTSIPCVPKEFSNNNIDGF